MSILGFITGGAIVDVTTVPPAVVNSTRQLIVRLSKEAIALPWREVYFGAGAPSLSLPAEVLALTGRSFALGRSRVFSVLTVAGEKTYYVVPQAFGSPTFSVGGFAGGFSLGATGVDVNGDGVLYDVYESDQSNLGQLEVVVT